MDNKLIGSVFLQTERNYKNFAQILREVIYLSVNAEKIVQKLYPEFSINPVMLDDELSVLGMKHKEKCLIGFNYSSFSGFAYYIIYSIIYLTAIHNNLKWYFDGYNCFWADDNYRNAFMMNIKKTLEEKTPEQKKNISLTFWELRTFFDKQFKHTAF